MLSPSFKPRSCEICGKDFSPFQSTQKVCGLRCAQRVGKVLRAKGKKELRERKEALKRIPDYIKEAQHAFNAFIRERDKDKPCISCGGALSRGDGGVTGGDFDCGHFKSTGSAAHQRFTEENAAGQCKHCNHYLSGNVVQYRAGLIKRIGLEAVEALEADNRVHKWTREELIAIRATYKEKLKQLKGSDRDA